MSIPRPTASNFKATGLLHRRSFQLLAAPVVLAGVAAGVWGLWLRPTDAGADIPLAQVQRGPLLISVSAAGTIQNRQRTAVKNRVEGTTTILYLIPEGTQVSAGELLVELDASRLQDDRMQQQITSMNAEAVFIRAREALAVIKSQADSDVAKAELTLKFAQQDLTKYKEGEYPRQQQQGEADINIAKEELQRATDKMDWSRKLASEGFITRTELQADELAAKRAEINLKLAESALELLNKYTHQRSLDQLESDLKQAQEAMERTQRKAAADVVQAEADLKAKESENERQKLKLDKINDQIAKCRLTAPVTGMVVYATTGQTNRGGNMTPLEEGQAVRERQDLIYMPTDAAMMAEIKIHESSLRKVARDMPVRVTVDAVPGTVFWGRVGKIGLLPDGQSAAMNPDLKVYNTQVEIDGEARMLRSGMTCRAEIIVEQYDDALFVPVQSVVRVNGKTVVYVPTSEGPQPREVEIGLDNNRMIRLIGGVSQGQKVLLAPPLAPSAANEDTGQPASAPASQPSRPRRFGSASTQAASSQAASGPDSQPAGALDFSKLRDMSPEERRKFMEDLTPEQREELRKRGGPTRRGARPAQENP